MILLRSLAFNLAFYGWTALMTLACLPLFVLPARLVAPCSRLWARGTLFLLGAIAGLRHELRGLENLPPAPAIIAAKHQSAWDTIVFVALLPRAVYVLKRELLWIPLYGWYAARAGHIAVDRKAGARALAGMLKDAAARLAETPPPHLVIFPQGTRTAPGRRAPYLPGVAALARGLDLPVVPVALNSGLYWGRRAFAKRPGTILLEVLPAIPAGLPRGEVMARLETAIETATDRLIAEAAAERDPPAT
ncbi:MAG: lysophospholipid acyltransferase family protein [Thalassobaculales bacterium]